MIGSYSVTGEIKQFMAKSLQIGSVKVPNRVILAPMSGITDAPFRRLAERHGAGLVVSEMTACAALVEGQREARVRSEGRGVAIHVVQLAGCEAHWMARGRPHRGGARRRHHRHQHGLPVQAGHQWRRRLGADARSRSCPDLDRRNGRRRARAGHAENAAGLGPRQHQCAGPRAPRGSGWGSNDYRAWPHPLPVLRRQR